MRQSFMSKKCANTFTYIQNVIIVGIMLSEAYFSL